MIIKAALLFFCTVNVFAQTRSFIEIFPNIDRSIRTEVFSNTGYYRIIKGERRPNLLGNSVTSRINPQITNRILAREPLYIVEYLWVVSKDPDTVSLLDIYNTFGEIQRLNRTIDRTDPNNPPVFREATRIESERQPNAIPDPPRSRTLPRTETFHARVRDDNFGHIFLRTEMSVFENGLFYAMTNSRNITFLFVPIIGRENFLAQLYVEPISEGILMYCIAGADVPAFLTTRLNIDHLIIRRLNFIVTWAADGIMN